MRPSISETAASVWGKTDRTGRSLIGWMPLWRHLADSAGVAARLWDHWVSPATAQRISRELPGGLDDARILLTWLAGVHDVGKVTPPFACQSAPHAQQMWDKGLTYPRELIKQDRRMAPHATAGHLILQEWLSEEHGWPDPHAFAVVVGGHHGIPPNERDLEAVLARPYLLGDDSWGDVQRELLTWMTAHSRASERLSDWSEVKLSQPVQSLLTGLVIVADWIASNDQLFPYTVTGGEADRLERGWSELDLPIPWHPVPATSSVDTLFAARFELPQGATPHPVQRTAVALAASMPTPGMMIIEAPMGKGKTEAALAAVEILAGRCGASGCFIALPTRATSDAMFGRVLKWLTRLPDAQVGRGNLDVMLAHGKAAFNDEYSVLRGRSLPSGIGIDEGGADIGVHTWLAGRKRSTMSNFVIGTIDQLLFASLRAKHLVLRHLGLAGKIVVIDEAHAYDVYMSQFLDRSLEWLGAYGVPVIVLSATLPARRRADLMAAYDLGRLGALPIRSWRDKEPAIDHFADLRTDRRYPLVTVSAAQRGGTAHPTADSGQPIDVHIEPLDDNPLHLIELLRTKLADGGCALIVRNTVARVQQTAKDLREALDIPVSVAHSRFMALDRAAKDRWLRDTFGPPGKSNRPERHIVVASQVAEQSLDIDFDLLITDLAPIDLVLQRIGRLHRHTRPDRPASLRQATCYLSGTDWAADPPQPVAGTLRVYEHICLLRAAAVLQPHISHGMPLRLPDDIAPLTHTAYGDEQVGPVDWQDAMTKAQEKADAERAAKQLRAMSFQLGNVGQPGDALIGWLSSGVGNADETTALGHVRDDAAETLEVILLVRTAEGLTTPPWCPAEARVPVPVGTAPDPAVSRAIAKCTLPLPRTLTAPDVVDNVIKELERRNFFPEWAGNPWLDGQLVLDIDVQGRARVGTFDLHYDVHDGLRVSKVV